MHSTSRQPNRQDFVPWLTFSFVRIPRISREILAIEGSFQAEIFYFIFYFVDFLFWERLWGTI